MAKLLAPTALGCAGRAELGAVPSVESGGLSRLAVLNVSNLRGLRWLGICIA